MAVVDDKWPTIGKTRVDRVGGVFLILTMTSSTSTKEESPAASISERMALEEGERNISGEKSLGSHLDPVPSGQSWENESCTANSARIDFTITIPGLLLHIVV